MRQSLVSAGYIQSGKEQVWRRGDYAAAGSPEAEAFYEELLETLRLTEDVTLFSPHLANLCTDTPTRLHFSNERANILRPFKEYLHSGAKVLEIGAGCGAVTRFLGETGAQVVAVEAVLSRASVARERIRDLPNVMIVADRIQDFSCAMRFDVIVIIGALEYAPEFSFAEQPALEMLKAAGSLLEPNGRLFLATANQLGLKYIAGVPEETSGTPMLGIEDRYGARSPRTFGRSELSKLLNDAGFADSHFYVPLPDFKMPSTILSTRGAQLPSDYFDAGVLAAQAVRRDLQLTATSFNLQLAWPEIIKNGLALDLSNSFLVDARLRLPTKTNQAELAYHYSTQRVARFARETRFVETKEQGIRVQSKALFCGPSKAESSSVELHVESDQPYYHGTLLIARTRELLGTPGWTIDELAMRVREHMSVLSDLLGTGAEPVILDSPDSVLPDHFLDATPGNLIIQPNGSAACFDLEWRVCRPTLGWVLWRSLLFILGGTVLAPTGEQKPYTVQTLISEVFGLVFEGAEVREGWLKQEILFQLEVTGKDQREAIHGMLDTKLPSTVTG